MITIASGKKTASPWKPLVLVGFAAAMCCGARPAAAQRNGGETQVTIPPPDSRDQAQMNSSDPLPAPQQEPPPSAGTRPSQAQPDTRRKMNSTSPRQDDAQPPDRRSDAPSQLSTPDQEQQDDRTYGPEPEPRAQSEPSAPRNRDAQVPYMRPDSDAHGRANQAALPDSLTLPAGTEIRLRIDDWLSTERSAIGDNFSATLDQPIVVNGWVVARRGQAETGRVSQIKRGSRGDRSSQLGLELPDLTLVDGQQLNLQTQVYQASAGLSRGRDAAIVGTTTGIGTVIGAIAGRGVGAAVGAALGATAGFIGVASTHGRPTVLAPETVVTFRLQQPVTITTDKNQFAFQPVSQSDYDRDSRSAQRGTRETRPGPPPPPSPYYRRPYGYYPEPGVGTGYYGYGR
jgi:hypothetical protein